MKKGLTLAKVAGGAVIGTAAVLLLTVHAGHSRPASANTTVADSDVSGVVGVSGNQQVRYLGAKLTQLSQQVQTLVKDNQQLQQENQRLRDGTPVASQENRQLQQQMAHLQSQVEHLQPSSDAGPATPDNSTAGYPVDTPPAVPPGPQAIGVVRDMSLPVTTDRAGKTHTVYQPLLPTAQAAQGSSTETAAQTMPGQSSTPSRKAQTTAKQTTTPYFTLPANSTLADVKLLSSILAEVPVNNTLLQPALPFKAMIGRKDLLASNGMTLPPDLSGIVVSGYSVGTMPPMSCARGYVTSLLFTFRDGSYTVVGNQQSGTTSELNPTNALGYLSTPYGDTCLPGQFITNAPKVLASLAVLGGLTSAGQAVAQAQQTIAQNGLAGQTTSITGSAGKYMAANTLAGGSKAIQDWYLSRIKSTFDAVYIPSSKGHHPTRVVININRDIPIDKTLKGRKIDYGRNTDRLAAGQLD